MPSLRLQPSHKPVRNYYASLRQYSLLHATHEGAVSAAFATLLQQCARQFSWTLVNQWEIRRRHQHPLFVDGAVVDQWNLAHGYWEAKDEKDDLAVEVKKKFAVGYPSDNILFQSPERAILYQNGAKVLDEKLHEPSILVEVLKTFFSYQQPAFDQWERAVAEFRDTVPQLGQALLALIDKERKINPLFLRAFDQFVLTCRMALNPSLSEVAVEKMLAQHILTERVFRKVFDNPDFVRRNVVASEIERTVDALTQRSWNRDKFLAGLDRFYGAIEQTAATIDDFAEKQHFLNTVYEQFFQGFDAKTADTHGIVYTPQSIVRFMVRSVDELLQNEFGRSLGANGVHILDPFVGTGNFILHVMRQIPKSRLPEKYATDLHANEVMLLPYYVASMNIEHEYAELCGEYRPFEGLCLVDTFELAEERQASMFTAKNAERVERQRRSPITVIIGNPPYNAWQADENDRNRNRKYAVIDSRVAETYAKDSSATLVNSLSDPYVKAFRWASDRLGDDGVLAFVSNSSYVTQLASDGMRKHLGQDFDQIYVLDLGGNVRKNPKLSGTTHNVFGIQVGVAIGIFVRKKAGQGKRQASIFYAQTGEDWRREQKYDFLDKAGSYSSVEWTRIKPDAKSTWLRDGLREEYESFIPLASTSSDAERADGLFLVCSNGVQSNNDAFVYDFGKHSLTERHQRMVEAFNSELYRWRAAGMPNDLESFLRVDERTLKWVRKTRRHLARNDPAAFAEDRAVPAVYRPFSKRWFLNDRFFNEDLYNLGKLFPPGVENVALAITDRGSEKPFLCIACDCIPDRHLVGAGAQTQCFPLFTFDEDGSHRTENISEWALAKFRSHYRDNSLTKKDIFHYAYAVLHHPDYRERYAANLKRELPRIPFTPSFRDFSKAGARLAELHLAYETVSPWPLKRIENPDLPLDCRVSKMRLAPDRKAVVYNDFLTLSGVPLEAYDYRVGQRSALEWIVDQYEVSTDARSGITHDPNRPDDPEYIIRLIGQVVAVSLETVKIVKALPPLQKRGKKAA